METKDFWKSRTQGEIVRDEKLSDLEVSRMKFKLGVATCNRWECKIGKRYPNIAEECKKKTVRELAKFYGNNEAAIRNALCHYGLKAKPLEMGGNKDGVREEKIEYNEKNVEYCRTHTVQEILKFFKVSLPTFYRWRKRHNVEFKRIKKEFVSIPKGTKCSSVKELVRKTGCSSTSAYRYFVSINALSLSRKGLIPNEKSSLEYARNHTVSEIAKRFGTSYGNAYLWCKRNGVEFKKEKPGKKRKEDR